MSDNKDGFKRFRIARKVREPEPYSKQVLNEVDRDEADKGTPEMSRGVSKGCMGCLRVTLLFFLIMLASIITTWCIRRPPV